MYLLYTAGISTLCCAVGAVLTVNNKMYTMQGKCYLGVHADADRDQCKEKTKQNKLTIGSGWWTHACMWICCVCMHMCCVWMQINVKKKKITETGVGTAWHGVRACWHVGALHVLADADGGCGCIACLCGCTACGQMRGRKRKKKKNRILTYRMGMCTQRGRHTDGLIGVWTWMCCVHAGEYKGKKKKKKNTFCWWG